jgi:methylamine dehydrogenase accessory protein MauD
MLDRGFPFSENAFYHVDAAQQDLLLMPVWLLIMFVALWVALLALAFLLLGALRALGLLSWRLEQLEATMPNRTGRSGLRIGKKAPEFTLAGASGNDISLRDFAGRQVLLVFTQAGCAPCHKVMPDLNQLSDSNVQVLVVNNGDPRTTRQWAAEVKARFPVLAQERFNVSRRYEVFATPFAFLIDERGVIKSKGIINNAQHIRFVLSGARRGVKQDQIEVEPSGADEKESAVSVPSSN